MYVIQYMYHRIYITARCDAYNRLVIDPRSKVVRSSGGLVMLPWKTWESLGGGTPKNNIAPEIGWLGWWVYSWKGLLAGTMFLGVYP